MIHGIGTDIVDIRRIQSAVDQFGDRFPARILGQNELTQYGLLSNSGKARFLAKRFSLKEAAAKALGTGFRNGVILKNFNLSHDELGKPLLRLSGKAREIAQANGVNESHVSLSDEKNYTVAYVIMTT
ncbi:MAG: holo-ACP synthase [Gammaproteobacteria bacterium]|nr:MAG: holo-ACP synthase [Gammaproteobacteria bacterium]